MKLQNIITSQTYIWCDLYHLSIRYQNIFVYRQSTSNAFNEMQINYLYVKHLLISYMHLSSIDQFIKQSNNKIHVYMFIINGLNWYIITDKLDVIIIIEYMMFLINLFHLTVCRSETSHCWCDGVTECNPNHRGRKTKERKPVSAETDVWWWV